MKTTPQRDSLEAPEPGDGDDQQHRNPILRFLGELPGLILMAFVLAILIKTLLVQAFYIPSGSMEQTLQIGDRVLVQKVSYYFGDPETGDVIVFRDPTPGQTPDRGLIGGFFHWLFEGLGVQRPDSEDFIKRVIGTPGDTVWARDGTVYVNGTPLDEPYLKEKTADFPKTKVPPGKLFVMGDNRNNSLDSRFGLGFVDEGDVIGKAFVVIWPPSDASTL